MIKAIVFDVDGTLYDETHAKIKAELQAADHIGSIADMDVCEVYETFRASKEYVIEAYKGKPEAIDRMAWYEETFGRLGIKSISKEEARDYYWDVVYNNIEPYYDLLAVLPELSEKYKLYVLTDELLEIQKKKLQILGLNNYFCDVISSESIGESKPSKALFEHVLGIAELSADEVLFVGDNPRADIKGGNGVGMKTAWLKRGKYFYYDMSEDEKPDITFINYIQLKTHIDSIK